MAGNEEIRRGGGEEVTDIIIGDPVTPLATADWGHFYPTPPHIVMATAVLQVVPPPLSLPDGRYKVQYKRGGRPQPQKRRRFENGPLLSFIYLDEKDE